MCSRGGSSTSYTAAQAAGVCYVAEAAVRAQQKEALEEAGVAHCAEDAVAAKTQQKWQRGEAGLTYLILVAESSAPSAP